MTPRHRIRLGFGGDIYNVSPIWSDGAKLRLYREEESGLAELRIRINETFTFKRDDYDLIFLAPFATKFSLWIDESADGGETYTELPFVGEFYRTDCEIDEDNKECVVKIESDDKYRYLIPGLEREFDLIDLGPDVNELLYKKQAVIQVHSIDTNIIMNYLQGTYWETEFDRNTYPYDPADVNSGYSDFPLRNYYKFGDQYQRIFLPGSGNITPDVSGLYLIPTAPDTKYWREDSAYYIENVAAGPLDPSENKIFTAAGVAVYEMPVGDVLTPFPIPEGFFTRNNTPGGTFTSLTDPSSKTNAFFFAFYARLLTLPDSTIGPAATPLPDPDISPESFGFTHVLPLNITSYLISDDHQTTNNKYGQFTSDALNFAGEFYAVPPPTVDNFTYFPINRSTWRHCSFWFRYDAAVNLFLDSGSVDVTLRHAYRIKDCLRLMIQALDPSITFDATPDYSEFLYAASGLNPVSGEDQPTIFVTPKSNITTTQYDQPAAKALTKLSEFLQMLWTVYRLKWFVDDSGRFRLEHVSWFENGGSYSTVVIGTNLTATYEPKTGEPWSYRSNKYNYRKGSMPEEIRPKWMDNTSIAFDGFPIVVTSPFVEPGNYVDENLRFTADMDFMAINAPAISKEGFALLSGIPTGLPNQFEVEFVDMEGPTGFFWTLQNGRLAFVYLLPLYHKHGLPAPDVVINQSAVTAESVERNKIQRVSHPMPAVPNTIELITTALGDGQIDEMEINLSSRMAETTVKHDTQ